MAAGEAREGNGISHSQAKTSSWKEAVAGAAAGMATVVILHPLDVLRTRFQVQDGRQGILPLYKSVPQGVMLILKMEGIRGFYAGILPALVASTSSWALYFFFYSKGKTYYNNLLNADLTNKQPSNKPVRKALPETAASNDTASTDPSTVLSVGPSSTSCSDRKEQAVIGKERSGERTVQIGGNKTMSHLLAATQAGAMTSLVTNPIWLVKTRLQLQMRPKEAWIQQQQRQQQLSGVQAPANMASLRRATYKGFTDAVASIWREEGIRGFYSGIVPSMLLVSHGAIQFAIYEELKALAGAWHREKRQQQEQQEICRESLSNNPPDGRRSIHPRSCTPPRSSSNNNNGLSPWEYAAIGTASKLCATVLTYPYMVVRSRLQMRPNEDGFRPYANTWQATRTMWRHEGLQGFYRGFAPHILRVAPTAGVTFVVYEQCLKSLSKLPY